MTTCIAQNSIVIELSYSGTPIVDFIQSGCVDIIQFTGLDVSIEARLFPARGVTEPLVAPVSDLSLANESQGHVIVQTVEFVWNPLKNLLLLIVGVPTEREDTLTFAGLLLTSSIVPVAGTVNVLIEFLRVRYLFSFVVNPTGVRQPLYRKFGPPEIFLDCWISH